MAIKAMSTKSLNIDSIKPTSDIFKALDKAASVNMQLPAEFSIPQNPEYALMTFNNLLDPKNGNKPRTGLGVEIILPDQTTKVITISSLSRKYFDEAVKKDETRGKSQIAVIDVFQDVNTMQLSPSQQVELIAGKTIKEKDTVKVYVANFKEGEVESYTETDKKVYSVVTA